MMSALEPTLHVLDAVPDQLGECATWCNISKRFIWTDIEGRRIRWYRPSDGQQWISPILEGRVGSFGLTSDANTIFCGMEQRLCTVSLSSGSVSFVCSIPGLCGGRINDGRVDRSGNFVFGIKNEDDPHRSIGSWYRYNSDGSLQELSIPPVAIANGLAFSESGDCIFWCCSKEKVIYRARYNPDGDVGHPVLFVDTSTAAGVPDGATVDKDGNYWSARWGAGRVVQYSSDGSVKREQPIPTKQPSCVAFGGAAMGTLFVTSARVELSEAELTSDLDAGRQFLLDVGCIGLCEPRIRL